MIPSSSSISSRCTVIECVSSLAYSHLISCSPAPTSRPSLPALSSPAMSRLCALIWIPLHSLGLSRPHSLNVQLVGRPHLGNSLPHLRLRQLCRLIPRHLENLLVHVLLQLLQCRASLGTTTVDFTLFTRSSTYCVCGKVVDIMSSAFVSFWVAFLVCFRHSS